MDPVDKVFQVMERLAQAAGHQLKVELRNKQGTYMILFRAGPAAVQTSVSTFSKVPRIVVEPFCEELLKAFV